MITKLKEQAASITLEKVEQLRTLIPGFERELNTERGKTKTSKYDLCYLWKNGSRLDILGANEKSRGQRRTGLLIEEAIEIEDTVLNEVLIPTLNIDRRLAYGGGSPDEPANKGLSFVTTAGFKNSFAYEKLMELLIQQIIYPTQSFVMGSSWRIPVMEKLIDKNFVAELKLAGTFNDASFAREYESTWSGDAENAFFSLAKFDKHRVLNQPEYEYSGRTAKDAYYILGVDVARIGECTTEIMVVKVTPQPTGASIKSVVNIYTLASEDFEEQAIHIKQLFYRYRCKIAVIDANGLGIGLVDFMTKTQIDPDTGISLPPFGVANDEEGKYKKYRAPGCEIDAMYLIKANAAINTEAYSYVQSQLLSGKIKFLIDENTAKGKLMSTKMGMEMDADKRAEYLKPFTLTTVLREQMGNLVEEAQGMNIILKQVSRGILKDKVSALTYALYYIKQDDEKRFKNRKRRFSDFMFYT